MHGYEPHQSLIAPARGTSALWRLVVGLALATALFLGLAVFYSGLVRRMLSPEAWGPDGTGMDLGTTPEGALATLFVFAPMILALWSATLLLHRRGMLSLIGPLGSAVRQGVRALAALALLYGVVSLLPMPEEMALTAGLSGRQWLLLLPLALLGLLIQVSAEELVFRGYIQSQLAARFSPPWVWIIVPSILFGALHYDPSVMGEGAIWIAIWAALFGVAAADITARTGTLGPAIALHFVNNFVGILITGTEGYLDGLALYTVPFDTADMALLRAWMPVEILMIFTSWLAVRVALRV
ncbi:CPBP family intramembrane metalloprotease [Roseovarius sp. LXJ103]|uniref:CPBP family intramembrane glutamic endopeptidase n=1 Tax=Roseovarius carneus TaxID=2853164 RepID=UPI000D616B27|nr:type II CAAX endopeptidase family protein [Roseovarius carneus]MBZ8118409.1 CPBP family intramembrane metalloprotease [Roseovarius carneus]PWE35885.1 CPBP family intramembrane metalloprotease [Pelagicola sp. LXJ1103]